MDLYPAIDLRGGRCVRLLRGDYAQETIYADDPVAQASAFAAAGASWVHVVDLDAARSGEPVNRSAIAAICAAIDVPVQVGGGVRSEEAARALFDAGATRVVVGTAALEEPELVERLAAEMPIAVGLDGRHGAVATHGWTETSDRSVVELARRFEDAAVAALIVTEISRDGTLDGPDVEGLATLLAATTTPIVASGGVGRLADLEALVAVRTDDRGLSGVIVGRAIYEGALSVADALRVLSNRAAS